VLETGKVRALGISTKTRLASFPDIPPVADTVPGFDAASWQMLVAPAKTPRPIVDKLHAEVKAFLPELQERILKDGMLMMDNESVEALQEFVKAEIARWGKVAQQAGLAGTQ
jgi:tripartite-type tricarboxylate transporter receptor subunit TctC